MTRRQYAGGAAATTITTPIASSGGGTVTIATTTGWPDGAVGKFHVVIDPGNSSEEKILCDLRSGTTISFSSGGRGADGTVSTSHSAGAQIWLCYTALDADEANAHINAATASHTAAQITFAPVGSIAATTVQGAIAELDTDSDARLDSVEGTVTGIQANNWVTQARMADASVGTAELIDGNVTAAKLTLPDILSITRAAAFSVSGGGTTLISWDTEVSDANGFITVPSQTATVPSGLGSLYAVTIKVVPTSAHPSGAQLLLAGTIYGPGYLVTLPTAPTTTGVGLSVVARLAVGDTIQGRVVNGAASTAMDYTASLTVVRLSA